MSWIDDLRPGSGAWRTWQATSDAALEVFCCRGHAAGPVALIIAGVHGDEYEGPAAALSLAQCLSPDRVRGTIIAVPVANPAAFTAGTAFILKMDAILRALFLATRTAVHRNDWPRQSLEKWRRAPII